MDSSLHAAADAPNEVAVRLQRLLDQYSDRRVVIVGGTCIGKSTLIAQMTRVADMDELVFPLLTKAESDYVCQSPWTPEIGREMERLTREKVSVEPGLAVFGTIVLDADLVVRLTISDALLQERTAMRGVSFEAAKEMQAQIDDNIASSGIPVVEFDVG